MFPILTTFSSISPAKAIDDSLMILLIVLLMICFYAFQSSVLVFRRNSLSFDFCLVNFECGVFIIYLMILLFFNLNLRTIFLSVGPYIDFVIALLLAPGSFCRIAVLLTTFHSLQPILLFQFDWH